MLQWVGMCQKTRSRLHGILHGVIYYKFLLFLQTRFIILGLLNGPLFKRFTYRQVAMFGSCLVVSSLFVCTFCNDFWSYMIFYAACYGSGIGITQSSNALALNTYFKEKRRIATGFSWTTTALGPIVWPYIIVALNDVYGMEGTLLLFAGFALHAFVCSLLLQPVEWHTKFKVSLLKQLIRICCIV